MSRINMKSIIKTMKKMKLKYIVATSVVAFSIGSVSLAKYYHNAWQNDVAMEALRQEKANGDVEIAEIYVEENTDNDIVLPAYRELSKQNKDLVGWIYIEDTKIDYPLMQTTTDPLFYFKKGFDKQDSEHGLPFVDAESVINDEGWNMIVYSHNMKDGSMFADILKYKDVEFQMKHPIIKVDTLYQEREYEVCAAFISIEPSKIPYSFVSPDNKEEVENVLSEVKKAALYDTNIDMNYGDDFLTLSTCDYSQKNARFVVMAKRIS